MKLPIQKYLERSPATGTISRPVSWQALRIGFGNTGIEAVRNCPRIIVNFHLMNVSNIQVPRSRAAVSRTHKAASMIDVSDAQTVKIASRRFGELGIP